MIGSIQTSFPFGKQPEGLDCKTCTHNIALRDILLCYRSRSVHSQGLYIHMRKRDSEVFPAEKKRSPECSLPCPYSAAFAAPLGYFQHRLPAFLQRDAWDILFLSLYVFLVSARRPGKSFPENLEFHLYEPFLLSCYSASGVLPVRKSSAVLPSHEPYSTSAHGTSHPERFVLDCFR